MTPGNEDPARPQVRPLSRADLDAVVATDAALGGRTRRSYFERRLALALAEPAEHVQFALEDKGRLAGHVLAHLLAGEFGRSEPSLRLEVIGVERAAHGRGFGRMLHAALEEEARKRGIRELRTGATWRDHSMLQFLDGAGYALAPNHVIDCPVEAGYGGAAQGNPAAFPERDTPGDANDYSAPAANDFEALARDSADVRSLAPGDLEAVVRIDRRNTGRERRAYMRKALEEALFDSTIRVSLIARKDGIAAGFIMARADLGDFGRAEQVAVIDAIGVDPDYAHLGLGTALLSQLFINLWALRIERLETVVAKENLDLLGFFYAAGFGPSQRLAFVKYL